MEKNMKSIHIIYMFLKDHHWTDCKDIRTPFLLKYQSKETLGLTIWNECHIRDKVLCLYA